jgi:hypothetical protein
LFLCYRRLPQYSSDWICTRCFGYPSILETVAWRAGSCDLLWDNLSIEDRDLHHLLAESNNNGSLVYVHNCADPPDNFQRRFFQHYFHAAPGICTSRRRTRPREKGNCCWLVLSPWSLRTKLLQTCHHHRDLNLREAESDPKLKENWMTLRLVSAARRTSVAVVEESEDIFDFQDCC